MPHTQLTGVAAQAKYLFLLTSLAVLQACGGGGGSSGSAGSSTPATLLDSFGNNAIGSSGGSSGSFASGDSGADGTAGDGAPIGNATVRITDLNGSAVTTTTNAQGYYQAKVSGLTAPLVLSVTKPGGNAVRYSLSTAPLRANQFVTINITGLSTQIASDVAVALGQSTGASALTPALLANNPTGVRASIASTVATQKNQLAAVIGSAGVDLASFDPIGVPFVANHTGYDYILDNTVVNVPSTGSTTTTALPAFNPLIGGWRLDADPSVFFSFAADGQYMMSQTAVPANAVSLQVWPGLEYGTYSWNQGNGNLSLACPLVDTNGTAGSSNNYTGNGSGSTFSDAGEPLGTCAATRATFTSTISGNTLTLTNSSNGNVNTFSRLVDSGNKLVGSWVLMGTSAPSSIIFSFTADGHFLMNQSVVTGTAATDQVWPGLEYGQYSWNAASGALAFACPQVDTNGAAGTSGNYAAFTDGLISHGNTPVGTLGGGLPIGGCLASKSGIASFVGNTLTLVGTGPLPLTFERIVY